MTYLDVQIKTFIDAAQKMTKPSTSGPLAWMFAVPVLQSFAQVFYLALHPRMTFRFFRGMGQQGVKTFMILRHLWRIVFLTVGCVALVATGLIGLVLQAFISGAPTVPDVALAIGMFTGSALWCSEVPTALGLLKGSFERRSGRFRWNSNLPDTGHSNFIAR